MLKELLNTFEKLYEPQGEQLILDDYVIPSGVYALVTNDNKIEYLTITKAGKRDNSDLQYAMFAKYHWRSKYLYCQKAVQKQFVSVHYLSFICKVEKYLDSKFEGNLASYYKSFIDINKTKKMVYNQYGLLDEKQVMAKKEKVLEILPDLHTKAKAAKLNSKDIHIGVFFEDTEEQWHTEVERYLALSLAINRESMLVIANEIYGTPCYQYVATKEKPTLWGASLPNDVPYVLSYHDLKLYKYLMDYLEVLFLNHARILYVDDKNIHAVAAGKELKFEQDHMKSNRFTGWYYRMQRTKQGMVITEFKMIANFTPKISKFRIIPQISSSNENIQAHLIKDTIVIDTTSKLLGIIHEYLFDKCLIGNLFKDESEIPSDIIGKHPYLLPLREAIIDWLYTKNTTLAKAKFSRYLLPYLNHKLATETNVAKVCNIWTVVDSIDAYLGLNLGKCTQGGTTMGLQYNAYLEQAVEQYRETKTVTIKDDVAYSVLSAQMLMYLYSKSKSANKNSLRANAVRLKSANRVNNELCLAFRKYAFESICPLAQQTLAALWNYYPNVKKITESAYYFGMVTPNIAFTKLTPTTELVG